MLEHALRDEAPRISQTPPAGLEQRIAVAIRAPVTQSMRRSPFPALVAGISAAAALVLLGLWMFAPARGPEAPRQGGIANDLTAPAGFATPLFIDRLWNTLPDSAETLLDRNPLRKEADAVYADARSAVQFLALNFLPTTPLPPPSRDDSSRRNSAGG
jgi:hypothetical protein